MTHFRPFPVVFEIERSRCDTRILQHLSESSIFNRYSFENLSAHDSLVKQAYQKNNEKLPPQHVLPVAGSLSPVY